jgi:hypothetical protein
MLSHWICKRFKQRHKQEIALSYYRKVLRIDSKTSQLVCSGDLGEKNEMQDKPSNLTANEYHDSSGLINPDSKPVFDSFQFRATLRGCFYNRKNDSEFLKDSY